MADITICSNKYALQRFRAYLGRDHTDKIGVYQRVRIYDTASTVGVLLCLAVFLCHLYQVLYGADELGEFALVLLKGLIVLGLLLRLKRVSLDLSMLRWQIVRYENMIWESTDGYEEEAVRQLAGQVLEQYSEVL